VAEAMSDTLCLGWLHEYWVEAARHLPAEGLDIDAYCAALLDRFANGRIEYRLRQIASDGAAKLRVRIAPVVLAERAAGRDGEASIRALATWILLTVGGSEFVDAESAAIHAALRNPVRVAVEGLVGLIDPRLSEDALVMKSVRRIVAEAGAG
jgi:fructuronate reductase